MKPVTVTLTQLHTHAGEPRQIGERLTLNPRDAAWLIQTGRAKRSAPPARHPLLTATPAAERAPAADGDTTGDNTHEPH